MFDIHTKFNLENTWWALLCAILGTGEAGKENTNIDMLDSVFIPLFAESRELSGVLRGGLKIVWELREVAVY